MAIRNSDIRGDEGLELRDQRNLLLDTLSQHMKIDVTYSMEDVGGGSWWRSSRSSWPPEAKTRSLTANLRTKVPPGRGKWI